MLSLSSGGYFMLHFNIYMVQVNKQMYKHACTCVQYSPASLGLSQAWPNCYVHSKPLSIVATGWDNDGD